MFYKFGVLKIFSKFARKHLYRSLFWRKLQVSILRLYWKKRLRYGCFLMNFARYLWPLFYTSRRLFLSYKKTFYHQNSKEPSGKRQKMETACKKNNDTCWKKLKNYLNQVFISFYYLKISLLLCSVVLCFAWYIESASFYK